MNFFATKFWGQINQTKLVILLFYKIFAESFWKMQTSRKLFFFKKKKERKWWAPLFCQRPFYEHFQVGLEDLESSTQSLYFQILGDIIGYKFTLMYLKVLRISGSSNFENFYNFLFKRWAFLTSNLRPLGIQAFSATYLKLVRYGRGSNLRVY